MSINHSPELKLDKMTVVEESLIVNDNQKIIKNRHFSGLDWQNEYAQEVVFINCTIAHSDFSGANLDGLQFEGCDILNCDFSEASIQNALFKKTVFYDKKNQKGCDFQKADLRHSQFYDCDISTCNFYRSELFDIKIDQCQAQGANFELAEFVSVVSKNILFSSAKLTKSNFKYSDFEGVFLEKCDLSESNFAAVIFSSANLDGANLSNTAFSPSQYEGLSLFKADLRNAEIAGIDIRKLDFSGVQIYEWQMASLLENFGFIIHPDQ